MTCWLVFGQQTAAGALQLQPPTLVSEPVALDHLPGYDVSAYTVRVGATTWPLWWEPPACGSVLRTVLGVVPTSAGVSGDAVALYHEDQLVETLGVVDDVRALEVTVHDGVPQWDAGIWPWVQVWGVHGRLVAQWRGGRGVWPATPGPWVLQGVNGWSVSDPVPWDPTP